MQPANILANFPGIAAARIPDDLCVYFNEFFTYAAADWGIVTTEDGTGSATEAITDGVGGLLLISNAAGADDLDVLEGVSEGFKLAVGKPLWFQARVAIDDTGLAEWAIGLWKKVANVSTFTTGTMTIDSGVYFQGGPTNCAADKIEGVCEKDTTESDDCVHTTIADGVYYKLSFFWDGIDTVYFYVDDAFIGKTTEASSTFTKINDDEEACVAFGINNSTAVIRTMTIDYIFVAQVR